MLDEAGHPTEWARYTPGAPHLTLLSININVLITNTNRIDTILAVVRDMLPLFTPVNSTTAVHRIGKLIRASKGHDPGVLRRVQSHPQYKALTEYVENTVADWSARGLSNCLWGLAAAGDMQQTKLVTALAKRMLKVDMATVQTQEISNAVWALATLEVYLPDVMDHMLKGSVPRLQEFIPQALSNLAWGCAQLGHSDPPFLQALVGIFLQQLREAPQDFQPQTITNVVWAYSSLGIYPEELFRAAAAEVLRRVDASKDRGDRSGLERFLPKEISNLIIAYARVDLVIPELMKALEEELCREGRLAGFGSQALANTLWAFATLRWYPSHLMGPITLAINSRLNEIAIQELANTLWAYAKLGYTPGFVLENMTRHVAARAHQFPMQACTNSIWALAILQATQSEAFVVLLRRFQQLQDNAAGASDPSDIANQAQLNQVLQAVLTAQLEGRAAGVGFREEIDLPDHVVVEAVAAWQKMETRLSEFHLGVSHCLALLGVPHEVEKTTADNLLSVDIAVVPGQRVEGAEVLPVTSRLAVEVDGPFHFASNCTKPLGHTIVRRRILRAAGWRVVSVPFYDWFPLQGQRQERLKYLAHKLAVADPSLIPHLKRGLEQALRRLEAGDSEVAAAAAAAAALPAAAAEGMGEVGGAGAGVAGDKKQTPTNAVAYLRGLVSRQGITLTRGAHRLLRQWAEDYMPHDDDAAPAKAGLMAGAAAEQSRLQMGAMSDGEGEEGWAAAARAASSAQATQQPRPLQPQLQPPGSMDELEEEEEQQQQPLLGAAAAAAAAAGVAGKGPAGLAPEDAAVLDHLISLGHVEGSDRPRASIRAQQRVMARIPAPGPATAGSTGSGVDRKPQRRPRLVQQLYARRQGQQGQGQQQAAERRRQQQGQQQQQQGPEWWQRAQPEEGQGSGGAGSEGAAAQPIRSGPQPVGPPKPQTGWKKPYGATPRLHAQRERGRYPFPGQKAASLASRGPAAAASPLTQGWRRPEGGGTSSGLGGGSSASSSAPSGALPGEGSSGGTPGGAVPAPPPLRNPMGLHRAPRLAPQPAQQPWEQRPSSVTQAQPQSLQGRSAQPRQAPAYLTPQAQAQRERPAAEAAQLRGADGSGAAGPVAGRSQRPPSPRPPSPGLTGERARLLQGGAAASPDAQQAQRALPGRSMLPGRTVPPPTSASAARAESTPPSTNRTAAAQPTVPEGSALPRARLNTHRLSPPPWGQQAQQGGGTLPSQGEQPPVKEKS